MLNFFFYLGVSLRKQKQRRSSHSKKAQSPLPVYTHLVDFLSVTISSPPEAHLPQAPGAPDVYISWGTGYLREAPIVSKYIGYTYPTTKRTISARVLLLF